MSSNFQRLQHIIPCLKTESAHEKGCSRGPQAEARFQATQSAHRQCFRPPRSRIEQWGRGTEKIVELCVKAGHPEPEFGEQAGSVWVRFLPSGYIAPHRVAHDLTERQREILRVLAQKRSMPLREIRARMASPPSDGTIQEDIAG